jgi:hypothetical protein
VFFFKNSLIYVQLAEQIGRNIFINRQNALHNMGGFNLLVLIPCSYFSGFVNRFLRFNGKMVKIHKTNLLSECAAANKVNTRHKKQNFNDKIAYFC